MYCNFGFEKKVRSSVNIAAAIVVSMAPVLIASIETVFGSNDNDSIIYQISLYGAPLMSEECISPAKLPNKLLEVIG